MVFHLFVHTYAVFTADVAAENEPHEGKRKAETVWPIFRIHHQRRYGYSYSLDLSESLQILLAATYMSCSISVRRYHVSCMNIACVR